jgi:hypothetical protein
MDGHDGVLYSRFGTPTWSGVFQAFLHDLAIIEGYKRNKWRATLSANRQILLAGTLFVSVWWDDATNTFTIWDQVIWIGMGMGNGTRYRRQAHGQGPKVLFIDHTSEETWYRRNKEKT